MMTLDHLTVISQLQRGSNRARGLEEEVYTDRKIGAVDKSHVILLDQPTDAQHLVVPTGGSNNHPGPNLGTCLDIGQNSVRTRKVDNDVNGTKRLRRNSGSVRIRRAA